MELIWTVQNPFEATIKLEQDGSDITKRILTLDNLTKEKNYTSVTISDGNEELAVAKEVGGVNWVTDNWNETDGGTLVGELESNWTNWMDGKLLTITLNLTDGSAKTVTVKAP